MAVVTQQARDDACGPDLNEAGMLVYGSIAFYGLVAGFTTLAVVLIGGGLPLAVPVGCLAVGALCGWHWRRIHQRQQVRLQILNHGQRIPATVVQYSCDIYNGVDFAAQPYFWVTLKYAIAGGERDCKMKVTDRVYLAAKHSPTLWIRVLPERPDLWVLAEDAPSPPG